MKAAIKLYTLQDAEENCVWSLHVQRFKKNIYMEFFNSKIQDFGLHLGLHNLTKILLSPNSQHDQIKKIEFRLDSYLLYKFR